MEYRKKPVVIEATQWWGFRDGPHNLGVVPYIPKAICCKKCSLSLGVHGWIDTLEGGHIVCPKDWIITGVKGEKYPCKPDIFEMTYELVKEADNGN